MKQTLHLSGHTARLNELLRSVRSRISLKKRDRQWVTLECRSQGLAPAAGKRRVSVRVLLGPGRRSFDGDGVWKSLLDALVHARMLVDDGPKWCGCGEVTFARGKADGMEITLEDLA